MLALVQHCLDHCQPARSYLLEMPKTGTVLVLLPEINDFFAKSTMMLALHFTLFSERANTAHFLLIFPGGLPTHQIDWQITILLIDDRQDNYKRVEWRHQMFVYRLSPPFLFPFLAIFSPNGEPVHRLLKVGLGGLHCSISIQFATMLLT